MMVIHYGREVFWRNVPPDRALEVLRELHSMLDVELHIGPERSEGPDDPLLLEIHISPPPRYVLDEFATMEALLK